MQIAESGLYRITWENETWLWVRLRGGDGVEGWGEMGGLNNVDTLMAQAFSLVSAPLRKMDIQDVPTAVSALRRWCYPDIYSNYFMMSALSAIDQALWDMHARRLGQPLWRCLGGSGMGQIPLYANLNKELRLSRGPEQLCRNGEAAVSAGFRFVKCAPFDEVIPLSHDYTFEPGIRRYLALAEAVSAKNTAVDCFQKFNAAVMPEVMGCLGKTLTELRFIEDAMSLREMRRFSPAQELIWAGGETALCSDDLHGMYEDGGITLLNPDMKYIGGISVMREVLPELEAQGATVSLHNPSSPIATAISASLMTLSSKGYPMEFPFGNQEKRNSVIKECEPIENGCYILSDRPGIGVEPDMSSVKKQCARWTGTNWVQL